MIIDVHCHATPRSLIEAIEANPASFDATIIEENGTRVLVINGKRRSHLEPQRSDLERRLADMDATGIDIQVLSPTPAFTGYRTDASWAAEISAAMNQGLAEMAAQSPRFWAIGQVPLQSAELSLKEIEHLRELGLLGIMVPANVENVNLDDEYLEPVWARLDELEMTVFVHPTNSKPQPRMEPYHLTNCIGNLVDTSIALDRLILSGVLLRYPKIRFYFAHAGGFVPFQYGRVDHAWRVREDTSSVIDVLPSSLLSTVWFDTITHAPGSLRYLIDAMGDDRVVVGTDYPADMADAHIAETLEGIGLSDDSKRRVGHENAERLFGQPVGADRVVEAAAGRG